MPGGYLDSWPKPWPSQRDVEEGTFILLSSNRFSRRVQLWIGGGALVAVAVAIALAWLKPTTGGADITDAIQVSLGRTVYSENCASCHGARLEGQANWRRRKPDGKLPAPPHDETGHTWHHPDKQLFRITEIGVRPPLAPDGYMSDMPAFGGVLADKEIWAVLAFIKSTWPQTTQLRQERRNRQAKR